LSDRRLRIGLLAAALLLAVAPVDAASAAPSQDKPEGGIGLRLMDAPLTARDDPRARVYIVDHLAPGAVIQRRIGVSNTTGADRNVAFYAAAATIDHGSFIGQDGATPNELSTWTSVSPPSATVPSGATVVGLVTIAVAQDAAPGEQYAVVWAETRSAPVATGGVAQVSRVGIRLYVSVGPGGPPAANFAIESLTAARSAEARPTVSAVVHNTGGRALDLKGTLQLANGPGGLSAGPYPVELGSTLGIDDRQPVSIALDARLPSGPWDATVTIASGLTERTANATVTFPATGSAPPVAAVEPANGRGWRLPLGAAHGVLALAGVAIGVRHRRARRLG
jgi:hypothetical protein